MINLNVMHNQKIIFITKLYVEALKLFKNLGRLNLNRIKGKVCEMTKPANYSKNIEY